MAQRPAVDRGKVDAMADVPADEIAPLLAVPLDRFVELRTARVKALKAEGRRAEAAALAGVRKPSRLVWLVGELARQYPGQAREAADVARQLDSSTGGVRALMRRLRDAVEALAELAREVADPVDEAEVGLALRSVLGDRTARDQWKDGRLLALPRDDGSASTGDDGSRVPRSQARTQPDPPGPTPSPPPDDELAARRSRPDSDVGDRTRRRSADERHPDAEDAGREPAEETRRREKKNDAARRAEDEARRRDDAAAEHARQRAREAIDRADAQVRTARAARISATDVVGGLERRLSDLRGELDAARRQAEAAEHAEVEAVERLVEAHAGQGDPPGRRRPRGGRG